MVEAASADIVYLYDDLGRLVRVIREDGEAATYHYDAVGNILQITRESGVSQTTTVTTTSQSSGGQGTTVPLTITGTNLMGATVVCTSPGVTVQNVRTAMDQITLELVIAQNAQTGPAQCEIRGATTLALPFSILQTIPVYLAAPPVSVQVAPAFSPFVATGVSVRFADAPLFIDRSLAGAVSVQVESVDSGLATAAVTVAFQPVITSVSPATGPPGTPSLAVRLLGAGFDGATVVSFLRNNASDASITVVTFTVIADGTEINAEIAIAPGAALGPRVIRITTPAAMS
ncbi:MAG: RHS repeat domain-containing protein, partial [Candidatus Rokuibacteriota bacterium]